MELFLGWVVFAIVVAIAAGSRGRNGFGWFVLSILLSPLVGLILVLVMPNLRNEQLLRDLTNVDARRSDPPQASFGGKASRVAVDRTSQPFEPDGVLAGFPYRVATDGSIEAIMQGVVVRFRDFDKFTGAVGTT